MGWFLKAYLMFDTKVGKGKEVSTPSLSIQTAPPYFIDRSR